MPRFATLFLLPLLFGCSSSEPAPAEGGTGGTSPALESATLELEEHDLHSAVQSLSEKLTAAIAKGELSGSETLKIGQITRSFPRGPRRSLGPAELRVILSEELSARGFTLTDDDPAELLLRGEIAKTMLVTESEKQVTWRVTLRVFTTSPARPVAVSAMQIRKTRQE